MPTSLLSSNHGHKHEKQLWRDGFKNSKAVTTSTEVILILGEPSPGDLSTIFRLKTNPSDPTSRRRRLLIFASNIGGLAKLVPQTPFLDIHILSNRFCGSSSVNSRGSNQAAGEAIHLVGVLEIASQFATAWRADAARLVLDDPRAEDESYFFSRCDSRYSSQLFDSTNHSTRTPVTSDGVKDTRPKPRHHSRHLYAQSNPSSKSTPNRSALPVLKGLLPNFLNFSSASVAQPTSPSVHQSQNHLLDFQSETYARTFDAILHFLPPTKAEKSLLKQVILVSTLCGQYFTRPGLTLGPTLGPIREPGSPASSSRSRFPSSAPNSGRHQNRANYLLSRSSTIESHADEARRTSAASSRQFSAAPSASSARSSTPTSTSTQQRWSMWSWLSTTSDSQASDPEPEATRLGADIDVDVHKRRPIGLRRRLSYLVGRNPKPETGEESDSWIKITKMRQAAHQHAYLIHVLPMCSLPATPSPPFRPHRPQKRKNPILDRSELLEKRRYSLPSGSPPSRALDGSTESATESFRHARIQGSLMRRATVHQMRFQILERRYSLPSGRAERGAILKSRGELPAKGTATQKRGKSTLAENIENFLDDYFGRGKGGKEVLPFILDAGVFGREVGVNVAGNESRKSRQVGEAILSGWLDEFAMSGQYWVGDEGVGRLAEILKAHAEEEMEKDIEQEKSPLMEPNHPPPAAVSSSSSEGSEGAASGLSSRRSRSRAVPDYGSVLTSKNNFADSFPAAMNVLKAPEPAHIYPPPRLPTTS